jgi:hypothetical protein
VSDERPVVVLGVAVAPGLARDVTADVVAELEDDLQRHHGSVDWRTELAVDRLVEPPAPMTELFDAARRAVLEHDWDLGIVVTDLPLRFRGRPVSRHVSPTHGVAVVSLPALGALRLRGRLRRTLLELVDELLGDGSERLRALAPEPRRPRLLAVPALLVGNLRLLTGMVYANRPWRLAIRLYGALIAAIVAAAYGVVTSDIWRISTSLDWWRLATVMAVALLLPVVALIAAHDLWERAPDRRVRDQVVLFNVVTATTILLGLLTLYAALFALILGAELLVVRPQAFESATGIGRNSAFTDYVALAWFTASLSTVGGALAAGLESREAMREAAYAVVPSEAGGDEAAA